MQNRGGLVPGSGKPPVRRAGATAFEGGLTAEAGGKARAEWEAAPHDFACSPLLLCFAGAFGRSEPMAPHEEDLTPTPDGLRISISRGKVDQEVQGQEIAIPHHARLRPVQAGRTWLHDAIGIERGPVFRRVDKGGRIGAAPLSAKHGGRGAGGEAPRGVRRLSPREVCQALSSVANRRLFQ